MSSENISKSFGKSQGGRLREIRVTLSITPEEAAKMAEVSPQQWRKYERGEAEPKVSKLLFLAKMGFSTEWIITGEGSRSLDGGKNDLFKGRLAEWIREKSKDDPDFWLNFSADCAAFFPEYAEWLKKRKAPMVSRGDQGQLAA